MHKKSIMSDMNVDEPVKQDEENTMQSSQQEDHERAYFDSADWALGKQGGHAQKPKGPVEALRPKLQPTPQQQVRSRRSSYASSDNEDGGNLVTEDMNDDDNNNNQ
ncbi:hypothetical protein C4D60_Mb06t27980 [Musa balbisiana]|uniref:Negatively light-regulated protein n=1 Tax=Musa balbisiana TaxID=52838 RepID=A0A4S8IR82_MUSBA|nr:hypothetical protein C4D60_Mb06t27980 [Musa balbisiana]